MHDLDVIRLSTTVDFRLDGEDHLAAFPWGDPRDVPRVVVTRHSNGYVLFRRTDLSATAAASVERLAPERAFSEPDRVRASLRSRRRPRTVRRVEYRFPRAPEPSEFTETTGHGRHLMILVGSHPVAWAWTIAAHRLAAVGSVETVPEYRRRGLGRRVLAAWVHQTIHSGRLPLFRHTPENLPAARLAEDLGGVRFGDSILYY
jgi:GNAT superfamily N-acetyltransferase